MSRYTNIDKNGSWLPHDKRYALNIKCSWDLEAAETPPAKQKCPKTKVALISKVLHREGAIS